MDALSLNLLVTAASVAVIHTVAGPDHWLPFLMLARARGWGMGRTLVVTFLCGIGHVGSSIVLGLAGLALGYEVTQVAGLESARGSIAAWALVGFGAAYALWGARRAVRRRKGIEPHDHDGRVHVHVHGAARHEHDEAWKQTRTTFWSLFTIFVLGPCEPMIPLFVIPVSRGDHALAWTTAAVFSVTTIAVMLALVALATRGVERLPLGPLERWSHAMAGGVVAVCGLAVIFLGL